VITEMEKCVQDALAAYDLEYDFEVRPVTQGYVIELYIQLSLSFLEDIGKAIAEGCGRKCIYVHLTDGEVPNRVFIC
jgi:hypothetical protein